MILLELLSFKSLNFIWQEKEVRFFGKTEKISGFVKM